MFLLSTGATVGIIVGVVLGLIVLIALGLVLYFFVFSVFRYRRNVNELAKSLAHSDALLHGQDGQYIHRLEIISTTNLLYVEKYEKYFKIYKELCDNDGRYANSMIQQISTLMANKQNRMVRATYDKVESAVKNFGEKVDKLDEELRSIIKVEENLRAALLKLRESYRVVKQSYLVNENDIQMVAPSFKKAFEKFEQYLEQVESYIESANYEEAEKIMPNLQSVITALDATLKRMPSACALIQTIIPNKILALTDTYKNLEKEGIPLYHLFFDNHVEEWKNHLKKLKKDAVNLSAAHLTEECNEIVQEIDVMNTQLYKEKESQQNFSSRCEPLYREAIEVEKSFLKICSLLPQLKTIYCIDAQALASFEELRKDVDTMTASRRMLDSYLHSGSTQPYSLLMEKVDDLAETYAKVNNGVESFKTYIESLKRTTQDAYDLIILYYYQAKQIEAKLRQLNNEKIYQEYIEKINSLYVTLNDVNTTLKTLPIDVTSANETVENMKQFAKLLFETIEQMFTDQKLAESAVVYANRDRYQQSDVDQQLTQLEQAFDEGSFEKVYHDASAIYHRNHVEDRTNGK